MANIAAASEEASDRRIEHREWQESPLASVYAMVIIDAVHYSVRENGIVTKKAAYVAIGTDLEGKKDVLGIWIGAHESRRNTG